MTDPSRRELRRIVKAFAARPGERSAAVEVLGRGGEPVQVDAAGGVPRPAGGVGKLLCAAALHEQAGRGEIDLGITVRARELGATAWPKSVTAGFDPEHSFTLRELCALSLTTGDNPSAERLRRILGPDPVWELVDQLGLASVSLPAGYTDPELRSGSVLANTISALDTVRLLAHIATSDTLGDVRHALAHTVAWTGIPLRFDDTMSVMHNASALGGVVNDAGIIALGGRRLIVVFLCDEITDPAATATDIGDTTKQIVDLVDPAPLQRRS